MCESIPVCLAIERMGPANNDQLLAYHYLHEHCDLLPEDEQLSYVKLQRSEQPTIVKRKRESDSDSDMPELECSSEEEEPEDDRQEEEESDDDDSDEEVERPTQLPHPREVQSTILMRDVALRDHLESSG